MRRSDTLVGERYRLDESLLESDEDDEVLYRAWDTKLGRAVTLRFAAKTTTRAVREARILGALDHPALVELYDVAVQHRPPFMVFGALEGVSLRRWVEENGAARWGTVQSWLVAILEALALAHERGFVHHDLHPDVVFVDPALGTTQLLGFGRTRLIGGSSSTLRERATPPAYWAPELFVSDDVDPRSDLYGAAAVAYFALTGRPPIELDPPKGMAAGLHTILSGEIRPPSSWVSSIPDELDQLLLRALERAPADRFESAPAMLAALDELSGITIPIERDAEAPPMTVGDVIDGRYTIKARIGSGGMSRVFLAHDGESRRSVALKSLRSTLVTSHQALMREAEALARVSHINVVDVLGVGSFRGAPYLVLEHLPGRTVAQELRSHAGRIPLWFALVTLNQVGRGLTAVHDAGLVHGDIKPSNVLLGPGGRVSLVDFGLVRHPSAYRSGQYAGTPAYLAPERIRGEVVPALASRMDVYALAVMTFEMLTGRRPFRDPTVEQLMTAHVWVDPPRPSSLDPSLAWADDVILAGLVKDPALRFASAEAFVRNLLESALSAAPEHSFRLLLADDEDEFADLARVSVESFLPGVQWSRASCGAEACSMIETQPYDVVLIDLDMPGMNGFELAAHVRATMTAPPPLACMTAIGDKPDLQLLAALGVHGFLTKPVHPEEVASLVMRLLEIRGGT